MGAQLTRKDVIRPADVLAFAGIAVRGFLSLLLKSPSRGVREFTFQGYPIRRLSRVRRCRMQLGRRAPPLTVLFGHHGLYAGLEL
jgi:hypothetical protein